MHHFWRHILNLFFRGFLSHFSSHLPDFMTSQESKVTQKLCRLVFVLKSTIHFLTPLSSQGEVKLKSYSPLIAHIPNLSILESFYLFQTSCYYILQSNLVFMDFVILVNHLITNKYFQRISKTVLYNSSNPERRIGETTKQWNSYSTG